MGVIGCAQHADAAIAPGLGHDPLAHVMAVRAVVEIFDKLTLAVSAAARVLIDEDIAAPDIIFGHLGSGPLSLIGGHFPRGGFFAAIGRSVHDDRQTSP